MAVTTRVKKERKSTTSSTSRSTKVKPEGGGGPKAKNVKKSPAKRTQPPKKPAKKSYGGAGKDMRSQKQKDRQAALLAKMSMDPSAGDLGATKRAAAIAGSGGYAINGIAFKDDIKALESITVSGSAGGTRYVIEAAKSGRSTCAKSGKPIPKGALRWTCHQNGVQRGGYTSLEFVTPKMLHNAIVTHGSINKIHGFETMEGEMAIEVIEVLREIARTGGKSKDLKKKKKKKKKKGKKAKKAAEEQEEEIDEAEEEILEMAVLSLDERLAQALQAAKQAGDVLMIDCSDDEEEEAAAPTPAPKEVVMEPVTVPVPSVAPEKKKKKEEEEEEDDDDSTFDVDDDDDDDDSPPDLPTRDPEEGDTVFLTWEGDEVEYLCAVKLAKGGGLTVESADGKFTDVLDFDPSSDMWRFSEGNVKTISDKARAKGKTKVASNPNFVKASAAKVVSDSARSSQSLQGLRFVITGIDEVHGTDFGDHVSAIIQSCGGRVTSGVSGVTDYLVAGTIHHNPFMKTYGPIEGGSKYKKAMTCNNCKIIGLEELMDLAMGDEV